MNSDLSNKSRDAIRADLNSPDIRRRRNALFKTVNNNLIDLAPEVLELMKKEVNTDLKSRCAWALGKLSYEDAYPFLVKYLRHPRAEVRTWCAWALGELGLRTAISPLIRARGKENLEGVQRAIGGAIKKISGETTRVHRSQIMKALKPPSSKDPMITELIAQLDRFRWPEDAEEIVSVRQAMKSRDPNYFKLYMTWVKRVPLLMDALEDDKAVFS